IGVDEYGKHIQGLKVSVGNTDSEEEPDEGVQYQPGSGHLSRDREENTSYKIPALSEEDAKTTKAIREMVRHSDENERNKLRAKQDVTYVYDMEDFHALVTQLFILQEAEKAKYTEKEV